MKKFLTLKHWQLFILLFAPVIVIWLVTLLTLFTSDYFGLLLTSFAVIGLWSTGCLFAWFYTLGTNLYKLLPPTARMNLRRYKTLLFIPSAYFVLVMIFMFALPSSGISSGMTGMLMVLVIMPLHLLSMVCMMYCLYFNAKALKSVEQQRPVTFSDYAAEFFLIWFFPIIGIWILQPRINKLFEQKAEDESWLPASE